MAKKSSKTIRSFIYSLSFLRLLYTNTDRLAIKLEKLAIKKQSYIYLLGIYIFQRLAIKHKN